MTGTTPWTTEAILAATGGEMLCGNHGGVFDGVSIDSRTARPGQFFVAVRGKIHDGHVFIDDVLKSGLRGVLIDRVGTGVVEDRIRRAGAVGIRVEDTVRALGRLGLYRRRRMAPTVVAVTGTNGKTTTREMARGVVSRQFRVLASAGNFNNEIGVPLTLLRLEGSHQAAILELGMNAPGEIKRLAEISQPDIGLVLNVGAGHLAGVGDIEGVARAKSELVEALTENDTVVLNADDRRVLNMAKKAAGRVVTFGKGDKADVRAVRVEKTGSGMLVEIVFPGRTGTTTVHLPVTGDHMVYNGLAAAAVGDILGVPEAGIRAGLESFVPVRMKVIETGAGVTIIDDTYNANPDSVSAAISGLVTMPGGDRRILVMGDMYELGDHAESMHRAAGAEAAAAGVDKIFAAGEFSETVAAGALSAGMPTADIVAGSKKMITKVLLQTVRPGDRVLVKGSRGMAMESVVAGLMVSGREPALKGKGAAG